MEKKIKIISTTGVVHYAFSWGNELSRPDCNSNNGPFSSEYEKDWKRTDKPVTCKNCLKVNGQTGDILYMKEETVEQALAFLRGELTYWSRDLYDAYIIEIMERINTLKRILKLMKNK